MSAENWRLHGKCRDPKYSTSVWYPKPEDKAGLVLAISLCNLCPVQRQCLREALEQREDQGIWGGKSEKERKKLLAFLPTRPSTVTQMPFGAAQTG